MQLHGSLFFALFLPYLSARGDCNFAQFVG